MRCSIMRDVLVQQPGILGLHRGPLPPRSWLLQFRLARRLRARIVRGLAALGFFLLLAFDLGDALAFRLGLALLARPPPARLRSVSWRSRTCCSSGCAALLLLPRAASAQPDAPARRVVPLRAALPVPAAAGACSAALRRVRAAARRSRSRSLPAAGAARRARRIDDHRLNRELRRRRLARHVNQRQAEDAGEQRRAAAAAPIRYAQCCRR